MANKKSPTIKAIFFLLKRKDMITIPPVSYTHLGLEEISEGELFIGDRLVNDVPPKDRDIAMVFQNYALYPHMLSLIHI